MKTCKQHSCSFHHLSAYFDRCPDYCRDEGGSLVQRPAIVNRPKPSEGIITFDAVINGKKRKVTIPENEEE